MCFKRLVRRAKTLACPIRTTEADTRWHTTVTWCRHTYQLSHSHWHILTSTFSPAHSHQHILTSTFSPAHSHQHIPLAREQAQIHKLWVVTAEKVCPLSILKHCYWTFQTGGKAKPLKAPKKEKRELDDDDIAFHEKVKAGMVFKLCPVATWFAGKRCLHPTTNCCHRCKGQQGNGRESERKGALKCGAARNQKVWKEVMIFQRT